MDARTHYAPVFLPSLVQYAVDENLEMVSVILGQETNTLAEKILLPFALALRFTGVTGREWLANGPCLLVKRLVYLQLGGLATVDIPACGVRTRVTRAEHMGSVCPRGFQPIRFSRANVLGGVQVVLAALLLASWLPMLALLIQSGYARQAVIFGLLPAVILFPWYRGPAALLAPVAIYLFLWRSLSGRAADNAARPVQNGTRTST